MKRVLSLLMVLCLVLGLSVPASAASTTYNDGIRHDYSTTLSSQAEAYYTGEYTWDNLCALERGTEDCLDMDYALFQALNELMTDTMTSSYTYKSLPTYWAYTDADANHTSAVWFYADYFGSGSMSREHVWPKSHASFHEKDGGADLHHLRPSINTINSSRSALIMGNVKGTSGASAYTYNGEVVLYKTSSKVEVNDNIKGDVARIFLYVWCRWEEPNLFKDTPNPVVGPSDEKNDGGKVIESLDTLLEWCALDPVDTWEMSRNDRVQDLQGNRNVFIDYPELAWMMFGREVPSDMTTPSGNAGGGSIPGPSGCTHSWTPATCTTPKTCIKCGATEGSTANHSWKNASCTTPKTCTKCGATEGSTANHSWQDATCTLPKTCATCRATEGNATGHINENPKDTKCDVCGIDVSCPHTETKLDEDTVIEATCTKNGNTGNKICLSCGKIAEYGTTIPKLGHINEDKDAACDRCDSAMRCEHGAAEPKAGTAVAPTCVKDGHEDDNYCKYCGEFVSQGAPIEKLGHINEDKNAACDRCECAVPCGHGETELTGAEAPTCTKAGKENDTVCFYCGEVLENGKKIDKLGHDWIDADCENAKTCATCGEHEGDPLGHSLEETRYQKPTCTESGNNAYYTCRVCDKVFEDKDCRVQASAADMLLPATGHTDKDSDLHCDVCKANICKEHKWMNATCTAPKTCSECGETEGDKLGHRWIAATCTAPKTCSVCKATEGKAEGHKLTSTPSKAATCTEDGNAKYYTCAVCQHVFMDSFGINEATVEEMTIPAAGHKDDNKDLRCDTCKESICAQHSWVDADCENAKTCTNCGETEGRPLGHAWTDATCTTPKTCSVCRKTEGKALGHSFGQWENGKHTCTVCGHQEVSDTPDACPHPETVLRNEKEATCTVSGYTGDFYCTDCGHKTADGEVIPAPGHTDENEDKLCDVCQVDLSCTHTTTQLKNAKNATCVENGYTGDTCCISCGDVVTPGEVIPATGEHNFGEWVSNEDLSSRTCKDCGYMETEYHEPSEPPASEPPATEPEATKPEASKPAPSEPDATEPAPAPANKFPIVPVIIVVLVLAAGVAVFLIIKKKKSN